VQLKCVLSVLAKIAAILDMYRNFFGMLVWHSRPRLCPFDDRRTVFTRFPPLRAPPRRAKRVSGPRGTAAYQSVIPSGAPEESLPQLTDWRAVEGPRECIRSHAALGNSLPTSPCYDSVPEMTVREHEYWFTLWRASQARCIPELQALFSPA
jgi:hypothetical protein